jgi:hypothetical protein
VRQESRDAAAGLRETDGKLRTELAGVRADLIKWSFVFWATTQLMVLGAMIALTR